jgi:hypothetical protein
MARYGRNVTKVRKVAFTPNIYVDTIASQQHLRVAVYRYLLTCTIGDEQQQKKNAEQKKDVTDVTDF